MKLFLALVLLLCGTSLARNAELAVRDDNGSPSGEFSLDNPSPQSKLARLSLGKLRLAFSKIKEAIPRSTELPTGEYVVWGDLFHTGKTHLLWTIRESGSDSATSLDGYGFAEWKAGRWQLLQLWNDAPVWRPKGWEAGSDDYLPITPQTKPFFLEDLGGGATPELMVAGAVDKYFQWFDLLRYSRRTGRLTSVGASMSRPEKIGEYVSLYEQSPRRAIWSEWNYYCWKGDLLEFVASWHSEVGYGSKDPTFVESTRSGKRGRETVIRVGYGEGTDAHDEWYTLTRDSQPFGSLRVVWRKPDPSSSDHAEKAWLFEKTTGLSRALYPSGGPQKFAPPRLEKFATVEVRGNAEAAKLFRLGPLKGK